MSDRCAGRISAPYLLVINIPLIAADGRYWCNPLWHKDLLLHLVAIERLTLACPIEHKSVPDGWLPLEDPHITVVPLAPLGRRSYVELPLIAWRLNRAIGRAAIVHTGIAGWPFPLGWLASPLARIRRRFLLINVESSFWRVAPGARTGFGTRIKAGFHEWINRICVDAADLTFFTTEGYRASLLRLPRGPSHVASATWVDPDQLISADELARRWTAKDGRLLFAGRLTQAKGVGVLLDAIEQSQARIDLIGEGELADRVRMLAARYPARVRLLDPVSYGAEFSALLDRYVAIVVPTLSDEQPRILFDSFARGVPAIAADTSGNRELVHDGVEGWLVPAGDPTALAAALDRADSDRGSLQTMGHAARATMNERTHEAMHLSRGRIIAEALARATRSGRNIVD